MITEYHRQLFERADRYYAALEAGLVPTRSKRTSRWPAIAGFVAGVAVALFATSLVSPTHAAALPAKIAVTTHTSTPSYSISDVSRYHQRSAYAAAHQQPHKLKLKLVAAIPTSIYLNPLRGISGLSFGRIDMGVDYGGVGPIYALGPGIITDTYNAGWGPPYGASPGAFICEQLTSGKYAGWYVYVAEGATPNVSIGERVWATTIIGYANGNGIETGFAAAPGVGAALGAPGFDGSDPTGAGNEYYALLHSLGG